MRNEALAVTACSEGFVRVQSPPYSKSPCQWSALSGAGPAEPNGVAGLGVAWRGVAGFGLAGLGLAGLGLAGHGLAGLGLAGLDSSGGWWRGQSTEASGWQRLV